MLAQRERLRTELCVPPPLSPTAGILLSIKQTKMALSPGFFLITCLCRAALACPLVSQSLWPGILGLWSLQDLAQRLDSLGRVQGAHCSVPGWLWPQRLVAGRGPVSRYDHTREREQHIACLGGEVRSAMVNSPEGHPQEWQPLLGSLGLQPSASKLSYKQKMAQGTPFPWVSSPLHCPLSLRKDSTPLGEGEERD